jgi:hypothetical protein
MAMTKRGDASKARKYTDQAKRLDPACHLLERAVLPSSTLAIAKTPVQP